MTGTPAGRCRAARRRRFAPTPALRAGAPLAAIRVERRAGSWERAYAAFEHTFDPSRRPVTHVAIFAACRRRRDGSAGLGLVGGLVMPLTSTRAPLQRDLRRGDGSAPATPGGGACRDHGSARATQTGSSQLKRGLDPQNSQSYPSEWPHRLVPTSRPAAGADSAGINPRARHAIPVDPSLPTRHAAESGTSVTGRHLALLREPRPSRHFPRDTPRGGNDE